jgi:hypothetical protein
LATFASVTAPEINRLGGDIHDISRRIDTANAQHDAELVARLTHQRDELQKQETNAQGKFLLVIVPQFINDLDERVRTWKSALERDENIFYDRYKNTNWDGKTAELNKFRSEHQAAQEQINRDYSAKIKDDLLTATLLKQQMLQVLGNETVTAQPFANLSNPNLEVSRAEGAERQLNSLYEQLQKRFPSVAATQKLKADAQKLANKLEQDANNLRSRLRVVEDARDWKIQRNKDPSPEKKRQIQQEYESEKHEQFFNAVESSIRPDLSNAESMREQMLREGRMTDEDQANAQIFSPRNPENINSDYLLQCARYLRELAQRIP